MVGFSWWWSSPSRPRPTGAVLLLNCSGQFLVCLSVRSSSSKIVYRELLRLFPAPMGAGKRGGGSLPAHFTRGGALGEPSPRDFRFRSGSPHISPRRRHFPSWSVSGGWTQRGQCDAPRGEEGDRKARRQGMPREAFQPGDLAFPQISAPARAPRPLLPPSARLNACDCNLKNFQDKTKSRSDREQVRRPSRRAAVTSRPHPAPAPTPTRPARPPAAWHAGWCPRPRTHSLSRLFCTFSVGQSSASTGPDVRSEGPQPSSEAGPRRAQPLRGLKSPGPD